MRAVFRIPTIAILGVLGLALAMTPVAFGLPGLQVIYVIPLGIAVWLLRTRTVVTADGLTAYRVFGSRHLEWSQVRGLRVDEKTWARAVTVDDTEVVLPAVRARDLPVLAVVSEGRITDPT